MSRALAVIHKLRSLGMADADILSVVEVMESSARSAGAERTARYRARKKADSCDVTSDASQCDVTDEAAKEKAPHTPKKENPPSKENPPKGGQKKGFPLPAGWQPRPDDWALAVSVIGEQRARTELAKFRDYWAAATGQNARKADWDATWRVWVRKAPDFAPRFAPPQPAAPFGVKPSIVNSLVWVADGSDDWRAWMAARPGFVKSQRQERSVNGKAEVGAYLPSARPQAQGAAA